MILREADDETRADQSNGPLTEEQDGRCEQKEDKIEGRKSFAHVTQAPRQEPALLVNLHDRSFDLRTRDVLIIVLVKNSEGLLRILDIGICGIEIRRNKVGAFLVRAESEVEVAG